MTLPAPTDAPLTLPPHKAALAGALDRWWANPSHRTWNPFLIALFDALAVEAKIWGRKRGIGTSTDLTTEDLALEAFSRFQIEFCRTDDGVTVPEDDSLEIDKRLCRRTPLSRRSLATMRLEYVAGRVVAFLLVRASFEFLRVWRKHQKAIPPISAFKNEEGEAIEFEDRRETYRPDTQMERLLGEARPFEVALVEQESARIFGSGPKTAQLEAYLVQLCLLHPDVLAGLGVPDEVFVRLNEIEATDRRRKVTKGSRAAAETESGVADAVQATTIGKFLNIVKNTALDRVEKFELFLRDDLRKACDAAGADFPIVCRHLLATAIRHGYPVPAPQADTSEVECA